MRSQVIICSGFEHADSIVNYELLNLSKNYVLLDTYSDLDNNDINTDFKECFFYQNIKNNSVLLFEVQYLNMGKILIIRQNSFDIKLFDIFKEIKLLNQNVVHVLQRKE